MNIFAKKAFQFDHPAGDQPAVLVSSQSFAEVPDWVEDSVMYKLASADGDVALIGDKRDEADVESGKKTRAQAKAEAEAKAKAEAEEAARLKAEEDEAARLKAEQQNAQ